MSGTAGAPLVIGGRYAGPPRSANGGVIAGILAGDGPAEVTILRPVPVDAPLTASGGQLIDAGGTLLAEATPLGAEETGPLDRSARDAPRIALADARMAAERTPLAAGHPFPGCFGCGPEHPSGLHCLAGPVGDGVFAVPFRPESDDVRLVWAALDCPSSAPHAEPDPAAALVLARIAGWVLERPTPGEDHVVVAWSTGAEGRRRYSASAVLREDGSAVAVAHATWVALQPHSGVA